MKALIPMAGQGSRFEKAGYTFPKPLISVNDKSMIQVVVDSLPECDEYIFLCRKEHISQYHLFDLLQEITKQRARIVEVDHLTEGATCTALLARDYISRDNPLLIANSDQYIEYSKYNFNILRNFTNADGIIFTFHACHPKWSFAKLDGLNKIIEVAEKKPISNIATCGIYYFKRGRDFIFAAEEMIAKNIRTNGEFYIAPVYNQLIETGHKILPFFVERMYGLGTPEDLELFLREK